MTSPLPPLDDCPVAACPFCGEDARTTHFMTESLFSHNEVDYMQIECGTCDISMSSEDHASAIAAWNRRAAPVAAGSDEVVARAEAAISLGERTGSRGSRPENIYNVAADLLATVAADKAEIAALKAELDKFGCMPAPETLVAAVETMAISERAVGDALRLRGEAIASAEASESRCAALMAERDGMAEALSWYREQASAAARYLDDPSKAMALLAVLTALALDGGSRACAALEAQEAPDKQA